MHVSLLLFCPKQLMGVFNYLSGACFSKKINLRFQEARQERGGRGRVYAAVEADKQPAHKQPGAAAGQLHSSPVALDQHGGMGRNPGPLRGPVRGARDTARSRLQQQRHRVQPRDERVAESALLLQEQAAVRDAPRAGAAAPDRLLIVLHSVKLHRFVCR